MIIQVFTNEQNKYYNKWVNIPFTRWYWKQIGWYAFRDQ